MNEIPGKQPGTTVYVYNDYTYYKDSRNNNILRCSTRRSSRCPGTITIDKNGEVHLKEEHNHTKTQWKIQQSAMILEMLQLCRETSLPLKEIFDSVCRKYPEEATTLSYATVKCTLYRERIKLRPCLPKDMKTLAASLSAYVSLKGFYKDSVTCNDGKIALIFTTDKLLHELGKSTELYVDGTFNIIPHVPLMSQMYTIHIRHTNVGVATIFILCECRSSNMYTAIWKKIVELVPTLENNVKFLMSDYEMAAMKAMSEQFPTAEAHGCWFHFNQALSRYWRRLGLTDAPRNILSMTMTMALIPSNYFEEAFSLIQLEAIQISTEYPAICNFLNYIRKTWLPLASKVSVYDCPVRTNNITESFHNIVGKRFRKGNIWNFLDNLQKIIVDEEIKLKRLQAGENIGCRTNIKNKTRDHKILEAQRNFTNGRISLQCFLHIFSDGCENFFQNDKLISEGVIEDASQAGTSKSDEDVASKTKSNTLSNNTNSNTDSNIDENIAKEKPVQEGLLHYEGKNCVRVKRSKRTQQTKKTKQTKRRKKLSTADKENSYNEHGNIPERSIDMTKFPKLVLPRIDRQLQINGRQALQKLNNSNCQV